VVAMAFMRLPFRHLSRGTEDSVYRGRETNAESLEYESGMPANLLFPIIIHTTFRMFVYYFLPNLKAFYWRLFIDWLGLADM
jgi:hypothetical protein